MNLPSIQIGDEVRPMTETEYAQWQQDAAEAEARVAAADQIVAARLSALAKLSALGLSDDEIAALVG